jgi:hypothetical protein
VAVHLTCTGGLREPASSFWGAPLASLGWPSELGDPVPPMTTRGSRNSQQPSRPRHHAAQLQGAQKVKPREETRGDNHYLHQTSPLSLWSSRKDIQGRGRATTRRAALLATTTNCYTTKHHRPTSQSPRSSTQAAHTHTSQNITEHLQP